MVEMRLRTVVGYRRYISWWWEGESARFVAFLAQPLQGKEYYPSFPPRELHSLALRMVIWISNPQFIYPKIQVFHFYLLELTSPQLPAPSSSHFYFASESPFLSLKRQPTPHPKKSLQPSVLFSSHGPVELALFLFCIFTLRPVYC